MNFHQNPDKKLFSPAQWYFVQQLAAQISSLQDLEQWVHGNLKEWGQYLKREDIYAATVPGSAQPGQSELNPFFKLLLIRGLRPEKIMQSFSAYVQDQMGEFYDTIPTTTVAEFHRDSSCRKPCIFILSTGADPTASLLNFAQERERAIQIISLGQGQGEKAERLLQQAIKTGGWVLLQNCHLARSWMPMLEKIVDEFQRPGYIENEEFRLFLTSMPVDYFPVSVLQNGSKLTTEPPRGLKANLRKTWQSNVPGNLFEQIDYKPQQFYRLLFGLTFFHAVIQERRKFGSLGFNIRYEFNESDIEISVDTLRMFINSKNEDIPWEAMLYMTGHINYGGRVTDDWDRHCLLSILKRYYCTETLQEKYRFSPSGTYHVPGLSGVALGEGASVVEATLAYIDQLPKFDAPEVFGMNENANITFQNQESSKLIETILSIQPRVQSQSGSQKSPDEIVTELARQLQEILPEPLQRELANPIHLQLTELGAYPSLTTVLF